MTGFSLNYPNQAQPEDQLPPANFFVCHGEGGGRNEEITSTYTKGGFELWQQQQLHLQQQHRHHQFQLYSAGAPGGLGVFVDDTLGVVGPSSTGDGSGRPRSGRGLRGSGGGVSCQDCCNQAKKDCVHMRCRTCCKTRNFQCSTHVRSTWVPAAKRRERQQQLSITPQQQHQRAGGDGDGGTESGEPSKRPREITTLTCTRLAAPTTSGRMEASTGSFFPSEVSSPAVFRCVRVSAMADEDEQYAYQTAVSIGKHVFKGILYDQGPAPDSPYSVVGGGRHHGGDQASSSSPVTIAATRTTATAIAATIGGGATAVVMDPSPSLYPAQLNAFFSGTQFFPHRRP